MAKHQIRRAKYRILFWNNRYQIQLLSSNKKKQVGLVNLPAHYTIGEARREAACMYPDAKDVTP